MVDVLKSVHILKISTCSIIFLMLIKILIIGFYSRKKVSIPLYIAIVSIIFHLILNFLFLQNYGHISLIVSSFISNALNTIFLASHNYIFWTFVM